MPGEPSEIDVSRHPADWVVVGQYANGLDADLAVTLLDGRGIPATLNNREFVGMDWMLANATGGIKVLVPPEHGIEAAKVLRLAALKRKGGDLRLGEGDLIEDAETCLSCGAAMPVGDSVCDACGWTYTEELDAELSDHDGHGLVPAQPDFVESEERFEAGARSLTRGLLFFLGMVLFILVILGAAEWAMN